MRNERKYTDEQVLAWILECADGSGVMPTASKMRRCFGNDTVGNLVARRGGFDFWAEKLGLLQSRHASRTGWRAEDLVASQAEALGFQVEKRTRVKASFDMKINGVSVEVKYAKAAMIKSSKQWTWRIAKPAHTAKVYAIVADSDDRIDIAFLYSEAVPLTCMTVRAGPPGMLGRLTPNINDWGIFSRIQSIE